MSLSLSRKSSLIAQSEIRAMTLECARIGGINLAQGVCDTMVEFKKIFDKEAIETLVAFANHKGGTVLVGVEDSCRIAGVICGPETIQGWVNQVKQCTAPSLIPDIELVSLDNMQVVGILKSTGVVLFGFVGRSDHIQPWSLPMRRAATDSLFT